MRRRGRGGPEAMPSMFNARDADSYEQTMGRWSRRLAPLFIEHAGVAGGERLLEVGCGTGTLTFALAGTVAFGELTAIDYAGRRLRRGRPRQESRPAHPHRAGGRGRAVLPRRALRSRAVAPGPAIRPRAGGGGRRGGMGFRRWASRSADILGYRRDAGRRRGRAARTRHVEAGGRSRRA